MVIGFIRKWSEYKVGIIDIFRKKKNEVRLQDTGETETEKKLKQMTEWIKDDCRRFGVEESYINGLDKYILRTNNYGNDYYFYYSNDLGYVLTHWERGACNWGMNSRDDLGFRFLFQRHIILNNFQSASKSERFMSGASALFGGTQEYKEAEKWLDERLSRR